MEIFLVSYLNNPDEKRGHKVEKEKASWWILRFETDDLIQITPDNTIRLKTFYKSRFKTQKVQGSEKVWTFLFLGINSKGFSEKVDDFFIKSEGLKISISADSIEWNKSCLSIYKSF